MTKNYGLYKGRGKRIYAILFNVIDGNEGIVFDKDYLLNIVNKEIKPINAITQRQFGSILKGQTTFAIYRRDGNGMHGTEYIFIKKGTPPNHRGE